MVGIECNHKYTVNLYTSDCTQFDDITDDKNTSFYRPWQRANAACTYMIQMHNIFQYQLSRTLHKIILFTVAIIKKPDVYIHHNRYMTVSNSNAINCRQTLKYLD
eukprot:444762_1